MLSLSIKFTTLRQKGRKTKKQQLRVLVINSSCTSQGYLIQCAEIAIMDALILNTFLHWQQQPQTRHCNSYSSAVLIPSITPTFSASHMVLFPVLVDSTTVTNHLLMQPLGSTVINHTLGFGASLCVIKDLLIFPLPHILLFKINHLVSRFQGK